MNRSQIQNITKNCYRSLKALADIEEPAERGVSLETGAQRPRSILPSGVNYVPRTVYFQFQGDMGIVSEVAKGSSRTSK